MITIKMILSRDKANIIGTKDGLLVYPESRDLANFKKLTIGKGNNAVVMGRKTAESIGRILPDRLNIILSNSITNKEEYVVVQSVLDVILECEKRNIDELWVIGGAEIYKLFESIANEIHITTFNIISNFNEPVYYNTNFNHLKNTSYTYATNSGVNVKITKYVR